MYMSYDSLLLNFFGSSKKKEEEDYVSVIQNLPNMLFYWKMSITEYWMYNYMSKILMPPLFF